MLTLCACYTPAHCTRPNGTCADPGYDCSYTAAAILQVHRCITLLLQLLLLLQF